MSRFANISELHWRSNRLTGRPGIPVNPSSPPEGGNKGKCRFRDPTLAPGNSNWISVFLWNGNFNGGRGGLHSNGMITVESHRRTVEIFIRGNVTSLCLEWELGDCRYCAFGLVEKSWCKMICVWYFYLLLRSDFLKFVIWYYLLIWLEYREPGMKFYQCVIFIFQIPYALN